MCQKTPLFNDTFRDCFALMPVRAKGSEISSKIINEATK